jgi:hypothetical protein
MEMLIRIFIVLNYMFQIVVGRDGEVGITVEHSPAEAVPVAMLMNYCLDFL